ncbi:hypothetical protein [Edwardsiella tarda]
MNKLFHILYILFFLFPLSANAFKVDSLLKVMNDEDDYITLISDQESGREFIHINLSTVEISGEKKGKEIPFDPQSVSLWPIIIEPSEIVLDAGDEVRVRITRNATNQANDLLVGATFIPDAKALRVKDSTLQVSVGYKTWIVIPGSDPLLGEIEAKRDGESIVINNFSNKIIRALPDECINTTPDECLSNIILLPGATKKVKNSRRKSVISFYDFSSKNKAIKKISI